MRYCFLIKYISLLISDSLTSQKDRFGYYHVSALGGVDRDKSESAFFITKDFEEILRCGRMDSQHLNDCRRVLSVDAVSSEDGCSVEVKGMQMEEAGQTFSIDLVTQEKHHSGQDVNAKACPADTLGGKAYKFNR